MATGWGSEGCGFKSRRPSRQPLTPGCHKNTKKDFQSEKKLHHDIDLLDATQKSVVSKTQKG